MTSRSIALRCHILGLSHRYSKDRGIETFQHLHGYFQTAPRSLLSQVEQLGGALFPKMQHVGAALTSSGLQVCIF